jgi:serine/threonine protein kinase
MSSTAGAAASTAINELSETKQENRIYFGNTDFIDACIRAYQVEFTKTGGVTQMAGTFGRVYKVKLDGVPYFIKGIFNESDRNIRREIMTAIDLTRKIPDFVSKVKGAAYHKRQAFIIFEGLSGMNLEELIQTYPPETEEYLHDLYEFVYSQIKAAQEALNAVGYVHQDIKPANIFVELEGENDEPVRCVLIDFGLTRPIGYTWSGQGTPLYMPRNLQEKIYEDKGRVFYNTNISSPRHNQASVEIIRRRDLLLGPKEFLLGDIVTAPAGAAAAAESLDTSENELKDLAILNSQLPSKFTRLPRIAEDNGEMSSGRSKGGQYKKTKRNRNKSKKSRKSRTF